VNKITIDPFIDVESGYAVKANETIRKVMSEEIKTRFQISGAMEPDNLEASAYVLNGMVTLEREPGTKGHRYKVSSAVFEKASGRVLASSSVRVSEFDTTPMDIYKDSPVFLKGENYEQLTTSVKKAPEENVEKGYHDRLAIKSMQVKGDLLYEEKEYNKSFAYYDQAARSQDGLHLEVLNGQFTSSLKQGEWERAEAVYAKLIRSSIAETGELATKITFNPSSASPIEGKARIHNIYIRQIAKMVASTPNCRIAIIGHSSKTGKEGFNDSLSLSRSKWILKEMAGYAHDITQRAETIGRGYRENIVGTGADNLTDEIDRRVEFKFSQCGQ
jgi:outer membrane protein OmpA-like peptidoglycan-associated protein